MGIASDRASFEAAFADIDLDGNGTIDLREFCAWLGTQHYAEEDELLDIARAFEDSASWFGKSDEELLALADAQAEVHEATKAATAATAATAAPAEVEMTPEEPVENNTYRYALHAPNCFGVCSRKLMGWHRNAFLRSGCNTAVS